MHAPVASTGLRSSEVAERVAAGRVNVVPEPPGRSSGQIVLANVFTMVNAIILTLFVLVCVAGSPQDGLFVGVVVSNSVIGVVQEVRARRELLRLRVVSEPRAVVVRDGVPTEISATDIVVDDLIELRLGGQVVVDGSVVDATGLRLDESMLTGEARPVDKGPGDEVLSGSFVVAGSGRIVATSVGADSYASRLSLEAKEFRSTDSHLRRSVDRILRWLTIVIPVATVFLLVNLLRAEDGWRDAVIGTVAAAVSMVPDGLVLLTSLAFMAGSIAIARRNALTKQLPTVEVLARVDVLCLDKTGTITTGAISFVGVHPAPGHTEGEAIAALRALAGADEAPNATMQAIVSGVGTAGDWQLEQFEPFDSERKWSAAGFADRGWLYLGAPEFLLAPQDDQQSVVHRLSTEGRRLLAVVASPDGPDGNPDEGLRVPASATPLAIVELDDEIRPDAPSTLAYFADQGVAIKVISGDSPDTVATIAARAGLTVTGDPVDARHLPDDVGELAGVLARATVFGRVRPQQKQAMVAALQSSGHVVAMTGDGVNDVLALKDADLGIAMGSGSDATRSVADLVLTDNSFAALPVVLAEGRKVINNVERVSNLFLTKTSYAVLLTLLVGVLETPFPFLPRQLTLISTFSIGVPGIFLALAPEADLVRPGFLRRVLSFAIPAGVAAGVATFVAFRLTLGRTELDVADARTVATMTLLGIGLVVLVVTSRPLRPWKVGLVGVMALSYGVVFAVPFLRDFFELQLFASSAWWYAVVAVAVAGAVVVAIPAVNSAVDSAIRAGSTQRSQ